MNSELNHSEMGSKLVMNKVDSRLEREEIEKEGDLMNDMIKKKKAKQESEQEQYVHFHKKFNSAGSDK